MKSGMQNLKQTAVRRATTDVYLVRCTDGATGPSTAPGAPLNATHDQLGALF
jgi:hypothetical protein